MGEALAAYISGLMAVAFAAGVACGVTATLLLPWLFHHVSISFS